MEESYYETNGKRHASPHLFLITEKEDGIVLYSYEIGNCETSYARSAILIENKKRIRLAHESLDEKVNQLILGAL